jgi:tetratricopeptide (TPR) repeat protein
MSEDRVAQLERRVQADPTSVAFAALAEEYRRVGRYQDAVDVSRKGLVRHPAYLSARVTLGRALLEMNVLNEAREEFEIVLRTAPENLAAIRGLAEIHHRGGQTHDSAEHYEAALANAEHGLSGGSLEPLAAEATAATDASEPAVAPAPPAAPLATPPAAPAVAPAVVEPGASAPGAVKPIELAPAEPARPEPALAALEDFLAQIVAARMAKGPADAKR